MSEDKKSGLMGVQDEESFLNSEEFSNGEGDYIDLPQFGAQYFSIEHAAILMALDEWARVNMEDELDFYELVACKEARKESQPLAKKIEQALTNAVMKNELKAVVFSKSLPLGIPLASRTYSHIDALREWAKPYGLRNGHLMEYADCVDDEAFDLALSVSRRRYLIGEGLMPAKYEVSELGQMMSHEMVHVLTEKIEAKNLQIALLEKRLSLQIGDARPLGARQRNNLLRLIGVLQSLLLPSYQGKQDALIADIENQFGHLDGLSKRNLETVFPQSKRLLNSD